MKKYFKVYQEILKFDKNLVWIMVLILISSIVSVVIPYLNGKIINTLVANNINDLVLLSLVIILLYIISSGANYLAEKIIIKIQYQVINNFKIKLLAVVMDSSLDFRETITASEFQSRFNEINSISALISTTVSKLIISFLVMLFILVYLFFFSIKFFIIIILIIPLYYLINLKSFNVLNKNTLKVMNANVQLASRINAFFNQVDFLTRLSSKKYIKQTEFQVKTTTNVQRDLNNAINLANNGVVLFNNLLFIIIALIIGIIIIKGNENVGMYVTLTQYITYVFTPLTLLSTTNLTFQPGLVAYSRTVDYIGEFVKNKKITGSITVSHVDKVTIENPIYKDRITKNYNIKTTIGERNQVSGENGSGKSTMFKLMANLYNEVEKDSIMINDINVQEIDNESLSKLIHFCPQEIVLLNLSVKENILIEIPSSKHYVYLKRLTEDRLTQKVIKTLDLTKIVNETASNLSQGEKKKIALLRLAITEKQILLIDELDASLDFESKIIMENILNQKNKSIIFEISHNSTEK